MLTCTSSSIHRRSPRPSFSLDPRCFIQPLLSSRILSLAFLPLVCLLILMLLLGLTVHRRILIQLLISLSWSRPLGQYAFINRRCLPTPWVPGIIPFKTVRRPPCLFFILFLCSYWVAVYLRLSLVKTCSVVSPAYLFCHSLTVSLPSDLFCWSCVLLMWPLYCRHLWLHGILIFLMLLVSSLPTMNLLLYPFISLRIHPDLLPI